MKKLFCVLIAFFVFFCGCSQFTDVGKDVSFTLKDNGNILSNNGDEYALLANEGYVYYVGELDFLGKIEGEDETSQHLGITYQTGIFFVKGDDNKDVLIRHVPNSEWYSVYRKVSLPAFDYSVDNCTRLEYISGFGVVDSIHIFCEEGITDQSDISAFLSDVRSQKDPREEGLYDLVENEDGYIENCYVAGAVYGFFEEEPNLLVRMTVTSFNDLAYSVTIENERYVLPDIWIDKLQIQ